LERQGSGEGQKKGGDENGKKEMLIRGGKR